MSNITFAEMIEVHIKEAEEDIIKQILTPSPLFTIMEESWLTGKMSKQAKMKENADYADARRTARKDIDGALKLGSSAVPIDPIVLLRLLDDAESWIAQEEEPYTPPEVPDFAVRVPTGTATVVFVSDYGKVTQVEWME